MEDNQEKDLLTEQVEETVEEVKETVEAPVENPTWEEVEPVQKNTKKSKGLIAGVLAVILALAVLGFAGTKLGWFGSKGGTEVAKNDTDRVIFGLQSMAGGGLSDKNQEILDLKTFFENMQKAASVDATLTLVEAPIVEQQSGFALPQGLTLHFQSNTDSQKKASEAVLGFGFNGSDLLSMNVHAQDEAVTFMVPALTKTAFTLDLSGDLKSKIKNAPLLKDATIDEQSLNSFVEGYKSMMANSAKFQAMAAGGIGNQLDTYPLLKKALDDFKANWKVTKIESKKFTYNGTEQDFDGFNVEIPQETYIKFLEDIKTFVTTEEAFQKDFIDPFIGTSSPTMTKEEFMKGFSDSIDQAVASIKKENLPAFTFTEYLTEDNKLVSFESEYKVKDEGLKIDVKQLGGATHNQNAEIKIDAVSAAGATPVIHYVSKGENTGDREETNFQFDVNTGGQKAVFSGKEAVDWAQKTLSYSVGMTDSTNKKYFEAVAEGKMEDIVKGKSMTLNYDKIDVVFSGQKAIGLKAKIKLSNEVPEIKAPDTGKKVDVFQATEEDLNAVMQEIQSNAVGLYMQLQKVFGQK
ncbi:hypothetical protein [Guggenheimella bovis]